MKKYEDVQCRSQEKKAINAQGQIKSNGDLGIIAKEQTMCRY